MNEVENTEKEVETVVEPEGSTGSGKLRAILIAVSIGLFAAIVFGLLWLFFLAPTLPSGTFAWFLFSFAAGITMIVLPCTLPLAFVIVPLSMGRGLVKGLGMALSFGLGVAITLSLYGVAAAAIGGVAIDALGAPLETIKNWVYFIAGIFALIFALGEIKLLRFRMPTYSGAAPAFIQHRQDYLKALFLGLFLGNIGVGCPHPATPLILIEIASSGDILYGWLLFLVHAIGRILPLLLLAFLGILGVNGLKWLVARKDKVERATGWAMVFVAGFILTLGLFTHNWWVNSGIHTQFEKVTQEARFTGILKENLDSDVVHRHGVEEGKGLFGLPLGLGNYTLVFLWVFPLWWWWFKRRKRVAQIAEDAQTPTRQQAERLLHSRMWFLIVLTLLLALVFIYVLPHNFIKHQSAEHAAGIMNDGAMSGDGHAMVMALPSASALLKLPLRTPADRVDELSFVMKDGVKEFRLKAGEFRWEYAPDKWVHVWGYNGQIPGPAIRVDEGDRVRVIVENALPDATTVHWHGVDVNWQADGVPNITQKPIEPGETFVYEFTAKPGGTRWYHAHGKDHVTAAQQLDMGLSGAFIIEPKNPAYTYDREYTVILDEWEITPEGVNPSIAHVHGAGGMPGMSPIPDFNTFTFNGRIFPYTEVLKVKENEKVLIRLINAGTHAVHPMHLHGHNYQVIGRDGNPLPASLDRNVITLHPGETVELLVTTDNPGPWLFHCHDVHHAAAGMVTLFQYEGFEPVTSLGEIQKMDAKMQMDMQMDMGMNMEMDMNMEVSETSKVLIREILTREVSEMSEMTKILIQEALTQEVKGAHIQKDEDFVGDGHTDHGHAAPVSTIPWWQSEMWWILFISSLALMSLFSFGVFRYLKN